MVIITLLIVHIALSMGAITIHKTEDYILMDGSTGREVTFVCTINPLKDLVTWKSSLFNTDLTNCESGKNECNPSDSRGFIFTADYINKMYRLTIPQMTWDNNANYTCSQGSGESKTELFKIEGVLLVDQPNLTDNKVTRTIEVTTGCIYPESLVDLKWFILKADNTSEEYIPNNASRSVNSKGCQGEAKHIQSSFTLEESTTNSKISVYFYVKVNHTLHGTIWRSDNTAHTYFIEGESSDYSEFARLITIIGCVCGVVGNIVVAIAYGYKYRKENPKEESIHWIPFLIVVSLFGLPLVYMMIKIVFMLIKMIFMFMKTVYMMVFMMVLKISFMIYKHDTNKVSNDDNLNCQTPSAIHSITNSVTENQAGTHQAQLNKLDRDIKDVL